MADITHKIRFMAEAKSALEEIRKYEDQIVAVSRTADSMADKLGGGKLIQSAHNWTAAVEKIGGVTKLTAAEQARVNSTLDEAIQKYKALGTTAPAAMTDLYEATKKVPAQLGEAHAKTSLLGEAVQKLGPMVAATFSVGAVTGFVKAIIGGADALAKMSLKASMSAEELQRLDVVAISSGSSLESLVGASQNLQQRIGSGDEGLDKAIRALNLSLADIGQMGAYKQLTTIGDAVGAVQDPTERAALAADIFGKSWKEILPALVDGMGDVSNAALVMSNDTVARLDEMGDKWDEFVRAVKAGAGEIIGTFPAVTENFVAFLDGMIETGSISGGLAGAAVADHFRRAALEGLAKPLPIGEFKTLTTASGAVVEFWDTTKVSAALAADEMKRAGRAIELSEQQVTAAIKALDAQAKKTYEGIIRDANKRKEEAAEKAKDWADGIKKASEKMVWLQGDLKNLAPVIRAQFTREIEDAKESLDNLDATAITFTHTLPKVRAATGDMALAVDESVVDLQALSAVFGEVSRAADEMGNTTVSALASIGQGFAQGGLMGGALAFAGALGSIYEATGNANKELREMRAALKALQQQYVDTYGSLDALNAMAAVTGNAPGPTATIQRRGAEGYTDPAALERAFAQTIRDWDLLQTTLDKYGLTLNNLGKDTATVMLTQSTGTLRAEWDALFKAGVSGTEAIHAMAPAIYALIASYEQAGVAIPENLTGIVDQLRAVEEIEGGVIGRADELAKAFDPIGEAMGKYQTRGQLQETADMAGAVFERMRMSGLYTADVLDQAWTAYQDALVATGDAAAVAGKAATDAIGKMDSELKSLRDSIANEAPEEVMGVVEAATRAKIADLEAQRDAAAQAIADIGDDQGDIILDTADQFAVLFDNIKNDAASAALEMADKWIDPPWHDWPAPPGYELAEGSGGSGSGLGFAGGTHGRYIDFGSGTPVTLHGRERVMTEAEGRSSGPNQTITVPIYIGGSKITDVVIRQMGGRLSVLGGR